MKRFPGVAFLTVQPTNEFNIAALFSESGRRHLLNLALSGNDSVMTPFVPPDGLRAGARAEAQRQRDEDFQMLAKMALATPERIQQFRVEMGELEEIRVRLIERLDQRLRESREKLKRLHDEAPEITRPDGTRHKVFRDFDQVRDETGALVSPEVIKAEAVSKNPRNWQENINIDAAISHDLAQRERLERRGEKIKAGMKSAGDGDLTAQGADEITNETAKAIAEEERLFNQPQAAAPMPKERTLQTSVMPVPDFGHAASGAADTPARPPEPDIKPQGPTASTPAPM